MLGRRIALVLVAGALAAGSPAVVSAGEPTRVSTVKQTPLVQQVKKIDIGSTGATITLVGGTEVAVDLGDLIRAGGGGGVNYIGAGLALFGISVLMRLSAMLLGIIAPFRALATRKRKKKDDGAGD